MIVKLEIISPGFGETKKYLLPLTFQGKTNPHEVKGTNEPTGRFFGTSKWLRSDQMHGNRIGRSDRQTAMIGFKKIWQKSMIFHERYTSIQNAHFKELS